MGDPHQVIIHDVGKVIGRIAVGLDEDHVVQLLVLHRDVSVELIVERRRSGCRIILPDDVGHAGSEVRLNLLLRQMQAVLVIDGDFLPVDHLLQGLEALRRAEAVIGFALVDELPCILHVESALYPLGLHIRADRPAKVRRLVRNKTGLADRVVDDVHGALEFPLLVRVLDPENKIPALVLRNEVSV